MDLMESASYAAASYNLLEDQITIAGIPYSTLDFENSKPSMVQTQNELLLLHQYLLNTHLKGKILI